MLVFMGLILLIAGCGGQQFSPAGRELMPPLQTAISAKKTDWLDAAEKKLVDRHAAGDVSDSEFRKLSGIVKQARSGDWRGAHHQLSDLEDAQRPTAADQARLNEGQHAPRVEHTKSR